MKTCAAVLVVAAVVWASLSSAHARGVILAAPRSLEKNSVNKLYLSLYDVKAAGTLEINLRSTNDNAFIAGASVKVEDGETEKVVELKVPQSAPYQMRIWLNGSFDTSDRYTIYELDEVYSADSGRSVITFIQTDKPLYKPGQQVKFRVLPLDRYLKPLGNNTQGEVWAEDPTRTRIAQWKNVAVGQGIQQFEFPLSEEPPLGNWKISARVGDSTDGTYFEVKEYVLPKFEVTVTPPSFVLVDAEIIPIEVCAKYTYGKPVQGSLKINSTWQSWGWGNQKNPVVEFEDQIDGCYTYELNVTHLDPEHHYSYRRTEVTAEVTEDGTGVTRSGFVSIDKVHTAINLQFLDTNFGQYFKPGMPYDKKLKVTRPDNTPAPNEEVEVCVTMSRERILQEWWATRKVKLCKNYTSDDEGIVRFQVPPPPTDAISLYLEARSLKYGYGPTIPGRPTLSPSSTGSSVKPFYSPSKSFIQVENTGDTLECGAPRNVRVLYTAKDGGKYVFHYQVISKGEVVQKGSREVTFTSADDVATGGSLCQGALSVNEVQIVLTPPLKPGAGHISEESSDCSSGQVGSVEISVDVTAALSPSFSFLVYYIRDDDETVADSAKFQVQKCLQNKVEFHFGDEEKQPGEKTTLNLKASPNSLCGTKVVDKSINLLGSSNQLTKEKVFQELENLDRQPYYWGDHCNDKFRKGGKNKQGFSMITSDQPWSYSQHADALSAFEDAGFAVLSDLHLFTRPCARRDYGGYVAYDMDNDAVPYAAEEIAVPLAMSAGSPDLPARSPSRTSPSLKRRPTTKSVVDIRSFFPETWLFEMESVGENGELVSEVTLPHTITEWIGNGVCVNKENGLGLSDAAWIRAFQAFFLEFTLPYSVIRGERVPLTISIFNYLDKCIPITRTISLVVISDGTIVSENSSSDDVCVCGGKADTFTHMFTPDHVGTLNFTVLAVSARDSSVCGDLVTADVEARDMATKSLQVEAEGFPQETVNSFMLCPEGSPYTSTINLNVPENAVEGSARAFISVSGSIMGPAIDNLDHLVRLPTGCGEQNMVLFTPNIVALDYLTSIGKLTEEVKSKALKNLQTGYQRELKYRHWDGSYSAFGGTDREGSMWLSAFVLKSFSQAKRYIDIDEGDIGKTVQWILQKQRDDGCFPKVGTMFSQGMKGGLASSGENVTSPLTAYVLTAVLASGYSNETIIDRALACIESDKDLTPYTAALYGYATAAAGKPEADKYLAWLAQRAITEGDEIYWKNPGGSKSLDVETAAYAILTILKREGEAGLHRALSSLRHLTRMRNANGGFVSTQDTVVGLEAVAQFASILNRDTVELTVKLNGGELDETVTITEENKLLVKRNRVPVVPSIVEASAAGTGCGLLQAAVRYNTLERLGQRFFSMTVTASRTGDCKTSKISTCVQYLPENQVSNMALVEIKMVSGFGAVKDTLDQLISTYIIKRFEIENNNVIIYFEELSNENICFTFDVEEVIPVENSKPAIAKVYDYYAKEKEETVDYTIAGSC